MDRQKKSARQHGNATGRVWGLCKYYIAIIPQQGDFVKRGGAEK